VDEVNIGVASRREETMKDAWVRIASSVRTSAVCRLETRSASCHACTLEATRTQAFSEESTE
jgi:hypothetical protein